MTIHLDVGVWGGATLEETCADAVKLAKRLGIDVCFMFNGVLLRADPDKPEVDLRNWHRFNGTNIPCTKTIKSD